MNEKIRLPRLLDRNLREIHRLHVTGAEYTLKAQPLSTASLTLPYGDANPVVGQFVEMYDTAGSVGLFRVNETSAGPGRAGEVQVQLLHALQTIADGVVVGYHEFGGTGVALRSVMLDLLQMQPEPYWMLGDCQFDAYFQYSFENENLLTALLSLAEPLEEEYLWTFDTAARPFILSLVKAPIADACEMRQGRNIQSLTMDIDRSQLGTRLWPLGYGEGVNQLTIADVNNGQKHIDADTQAVWGVVDVIHTETTITEADTLLSVARGVLEKIKNPVVTVTVDGLDVYALTGEDLDRFYPGRMCRVPLPDYGVLMNERVLEVSKGDIYGDNPSVTLTLANVMRDAVSEISKTTRRAAIGELYSQGSTNQYAEHFADNCDADSPMELDFYIDPGAVHINAVTCKYKLESFRSYSKGAASGGGGSASKPQQVVSTSAWTGGPLDTGDTSAFHYTDPATVSSLGSTHRHWMSHLHRVTAIVEIPATNISLPSHTHADNPGIYRGGRASGVSIAVDGNPVPPQAIVGNEFDAVPYLAKDSAGKITRGTWHSITITPNALTRIVADLHVKTFIRSVSGGNY